MIRGIILSTSNDGKTAKVSTLNNLIINKVMLFFAKGYFGKVKKGDKRTLFFELTNTSGQTIQVDIVDACECTKVDFPRGPIAPGGKGRFDVVFDSTEKDADETIGITVVFRETDAAGNPRIESIEYAFQIEK